MIEGFSVSAERYIHQQLSLRKVDSLDLLPREQRKEIEKEAQKIVDRDVFGADHKRDRKGNPIEQGLGSLAQPTRQSIEAYKKYHAADPDFTEQLAIMQKRFDDFQQDKKAKRDADD